jgi:hypothetical protein
MCVHVNNENTMYNAVNHTIMDIKPSRAHIHTSTSESQSAKHVLA